MGSLAWGMEVPQLPCGYVWYHQEQPGHKIKCLLSAKSLWSKKKRQHRGGVHSSRQHSWRSAQGKDMLVLARHRSFVLRCSSRSCVGKGLLFMVKAEICFSFWIWCEWLSPSKEKLAPLRDPIRMRRFLLFWCKPCSSTHGGKEWRLLCYHELKNQCILLLMGLVRDTVSD